MNTTTELPPIRHSVRVPLTPEHDFALFTEGLARWWPFSGHSCFGAEALTVEFEPRVGGSVMEVARDGRRMAWGQVMAWTPPAGFAMRWYPGLAETEATELRVSFIAIGASQTEVSIHHDGWAARGADAAVKRDQYQGGWAAVLGLYAASARSGANEVTT